ncbi:bcl-2-interacting killer isoform X2 [Artibeus jamaicensis]|uniref:bcl-2-interacting killer isoform X2 n=1 Tax=Artibeus jamaicensis TaxID=9417 RepID=UPI00235AFB1A|nr:bcl-2-interacting killer isoform X2 [Artibeus jamaicensis]
MACPRGTYRPPPPGEAADGESRQRGGTLFRSPTWEMCLGEQRGTETCPEAHEQQDPGPAAGSTACRLWGFPTRPVSSTSARSPLDDNRGRSAWDTVFLRSHGVSAHSDIPHEMAMRLAFIGDELEVRWMPPRVAQMPWMAVYSLAFTYTQTGLRGVLRSFLGGFTNLRGNRRFWSFLTLRDRVSPSLGRKLSLLLLLALLLDWGVQVLQ